MFHNHFIMSHRIPVGYWASQTPYYDERGNAATADYSRNILVIFLTANSEVPTAHVSYPFSREGGAVFPPVGAEEPRFFVPERTSRLFIFGSDGSRKELPLAPGEAKRIHNLMELTPEPSDLVQVLKQAYSENHSSASSASLEYAITALQKTGVPSSGLAE